MKRWAMFFLFLLFLVCSVSAYVSPGFGYAQTCSFTVTGKTNYVVNFTVYNGTGTTAGSSIYLNGNISQWNNGNPQDLRFNDTSGNGYPYWIENTSATATSVIVWVNVTNTSNSMVVSSLHPTATSLSNGLTTFIAFDHFDGVLSGIWTSTSNTGISNSVVTIGYGGTAKMYTTAIP